MLRPGKPYPACGCESRRGKCAGAPRSRLRVYVGEIPPPERSVRSPERAIGSARAGHVTAKATDWACGPGGAQDPPGVRKAARRDRHTE